MSQRWKVAVLAGGAALLLVALVFVASQGTVSSACDGVRFGRAVTGPAPPPVGGQAPLSQRVLRAFRLAHDNAVYCHDFADPSVLRVGDRYYAYSTNSADRHVPVLYGEGFLDVQHVTDALPKLPAWSKPGRVWGPAVIAGPGRDYTMFYATADRTNRECISSARASSPTGPFVDRSRQPWRCGAYDPQPFTDRDHYLLWSEGDAIRAARLGPGLDHLVGPTATLLRATQPWQAGIVEAPDMLAHAGTPWLFFSANRWNSSAYAVGVARCRAPLGPCAAPARPWLASQAHVIGPGGADAFTDAAGRGWIVLHAWIGRVGYPAGARDLFIIPLTFSNGRPVA